MARYCTGCGSPAGDDRAFCTQCGKALNSAPVPETLQPAPSAPAGSGSAKKIIIGLVLFFFAIAVLTIGGVVYVGYRVHKKVVEAKQSFPFNVPAGITNGSDSQPQEDFHPCSLITKDEIGKLVGNPITTVDSYPGLCEYIASGNQADVKVEMAGGGKLSMKILMGGLNIASRAAGMGGKALDPIPGIGDEAYYGYGTLYFLKGDVMVTIDTQNPLLPRQSTIAIARKVFSKM
jgi:hypothetical protein